MCEKNKPPEIRHGLSDEINTVPNGWDMSTLLESAPVRDETPPNNEDHPNSPSDQEVKMRTDFQLDPHFDRDPSPTRRDLTAY